MNRIQQAIVWLSRISHSRGFGIQSPSDYHFVTEVVNEPWPYYAYQDIGKGDDWLRRKLGQLYLRIANEMQPSVIIDLLGYTDYLHAGCRKADIQRQFTTNCQPVLMLTPPNGDTGKIPDKCQPQSVIIVEDIAHHRQQWKQLISNHSVTVTFDLYYCGIACIKPQRAPQHYIINF